VSLAQTPELGAETAAADGRAKRHEKITSS
jgi:hypothetical protein